jgi:hypothetical protein
MIHKVCITGVDVMITIFGDIWQFSAKKCVFLKTNVMINFLPKLASLSKNRYIFGKFFHETIF